MSKIALEIDDLHICSESGGGRDHTKSFQLVLQIKKEPFADSFAVQDQIVESFELKVFLSAAFTQYQ